MEESRHLCRSKVPDICPSWTSESLLVSTTCYCRWHLPILQWRKWHHPQRWMIYSASMLAWRNLSISNGFVSDTILVVLSIKKFLTDLDQSNISVNISFVIISMAYNLASQIDLKSLFLFSFVVWFLNVPSSEENFALVHAGMLEAVSSGNDPHVWDNGSSTKVFSTFPKSYWDYPWPWAL